MTDNKTELAFDLKGVDLSLLREKLDAYQKRLLHLRTSGIPEEADFDDATVTMGDEFQNLLERVHELGHHVRLSIPRDKAEQDSRNVNLPLLQHYAQLQGDRYVLIADPRPAGETRRRQIPRVGVLPGRGVIGFSDMEGGFALIPAELVNIEGIEGVEPNVQ